MNIKRSLVKIERTRILELVTFKRTTLIGHYPNHHQDQKNQEHQIRHFYIFLCLSHVKGRLRSIFQVIFRVCTFGHFPGANPIHIRPHGFTQKLIEPIELGLFTSYLSTGGYSILKQKAFEGGKSRALICIIFQLH